MGNTVIVTDRNRAAPTLPSVTLAIRLGKRRHGGAITVGRDTTTSVALTLGGTPVVGETGR